MADAVELHAAVVARLRDQVPAVTVYDGDVPKNLPADANGRVYPYVVVWDSPGSFPATEAATLGSVDYAALEWECRATVAAGDLAWLRSAAARVRKALLGYRPGSRLSGTLSDEDTVPVTQKELDTTPARYYVPLLFTLGAP